MTTTSRRVEFETDDRDAAADAIEDAFGFRARFTGRELGFRQQSIFGADVSFTELRFGGRLRTDVDPNPSVVVSEIPRGRYVVRRDGQTVDLSHGGLFLLPTRTDMRVELDHTVIRTYNLGSVEQLRRAVAQASPTAPELDLTRLSPVSPSAERYLRDSLALYRRHFLGDATAVSDLAAEEAHRHLLCTAASVFGLLSPARKAAADSVVVRRVRTHVAEHLGEPLTVDDQAVAAHCGVRALQIAFRRELGQTPMEFVREARLAAAHADLKATADSLGAPATVSAVALRWGFVNAGRFSHSYRRRFGEYPSDTLRRR